MDTQQNIETNIYLNDILSNTLDNIYSITYLKNDIDFNMEDINNYYTIIYNYLVNDEEDKNGKYIYQLYSSELEKIYISKIIPILDKSNDFIEEIGNFYSYDQECIKYMSCLILRYLERYYIQNNGVKNIKELSKDVFEKVIYSKYQHKIIELTIEKLNNYRNYNFDQNIIIPLFTIISLFNNLDEENNIYKNIKEDTKLFFQNYKQQLIDQGNIDEYYIEIEKAILREETLFKNILPEGLYKKYCNFLENTIILNNIENYNQKIFISQSIRQNNHNQFSRIYGLLEKVNKEEEILLPIILKTFEEQTKELVYSNTNIENYILNLLDLNMNYDNLFKMLKSFDYTNKKNLIQIEYKYKNNLSAYTSTDVIIKNKNYSIIKLLVTHINFYLTKKILLIDSVFLNKYLNIVFMLEEKDYYLELYSKYLAKRLLFSSYDIEKETEIINILKKNMGFSVTIKIENMIKDIIIHKDEISKKYKILTMSHWPIYKNTKCLLSKEIKDTLEDYQKQYNQNFCQRKIDWNNDISTVTIYLNLDNKYQITMTFIEYSIINLYKTKLEYTFQNLVDELNINNQELMIYLKNLINHKLLSSNEETIQNDTIISFNKEFKNKKNHLILPIPTMDKSQEESKNKNIINGDRIEIIKAHIVRTMKSRKTLSHNKLIIEVNQSIDLFTPAVKDIKKCIENLIEREYLERSEKMADIYNYLA